MGTSEQTHIYVGVTISKPVGSLSAVQVRLTTNRYGPFQENTLWLIFKCLADCLGMLHHGIEFTFNANREAQVIVKKNNRPIVHFDLKLENGRLGFA